MDCKMFLRLPPAQSVIPEPELIPFPFMCNVQTGAKASVNQIASLALPEGQWRGAKSTVPKTGASRGGAVDGLVGVSAAERCDLF